MAKEYFAKEEDIDILKGNVDKKISSPNTAEVGQILSVKAVDDTGKPTEWEVVNKPGSGPGESSPYIYMTQAEYEALTEYEQDRMYWVTYPVTNCHIIWRNGKRIEGISVEYQNQNVSGEATVTYDGINFILDQDIRIYDKKTIYYNVKLLDTTLNCPIIRSAYPHLGVGYGKPAFYEIEEAYINRNVKQLEAECFYNSKLKKITFAKRNSDGSETLDLQRYCFSKSKIEEIELPEGTFFGNTSGYYGCQFYGCENLKTVYIPTTIHAIHEECFYNCISLESIVIPESVGSISNNSFSGCTALSLIVVNKPQDSISGAPWGATNATVVWTG